MTGPDRRPVDLAMASERPEKEVVRQLWLETAVTYAEAYPDDRYPLYLTLSGAAGKDVAMLIANGLVPLAETGAIASRAKHRIIAVEANIQAVVALSERFPGLKIFQHPFQNLVRSESATRWPDGQDEEFCRARVVNLDLNQTLVAEEVAGQLRFPVLLWIQKLSQLHAEQRVEWSLCLTLHGEINWLPEVCVAVQRFLCENFARESAFRTACETHFGPDLFDAVNSDIPCSFSGRSLIEQQHVLMAFVPKKIAQLVCPQGWLVQTRYNLRYGGTEGRAPMVTWIIEFAWEIRIASTPDAVYRESLASVLSGVGRIAEDGSLS